MVSEGARNDCFRGGLDQGRGGQNFDGVASGDDAGQAGQDALDRWRSAGECCEVGRLAGGKGWGVLHGGRRRAKRGKTLLIEGDPQASAGKWAGWRRDTAFEPSPVTTRLNGKEILSEGQHLAASYEHTVIDV